MSGISLFLISMSNASTINYWNVRQMEIEENNVLENQSVEQIKLEKFLHNP